MKRFNPKRWGCKKDVALRSEVVFDFPGQKQETGTLTIVRKARQSGNGRWHRKSNMPLELLKSQKHHHKVDDAFIFDYKKTMFFFFIKGFPINFFQCSEEHLLFLQYSIWTARYNSKAFCEVYHEIFYIMLFQATLRYTWSTFQKPYPAPTIRIRVRVRNNSITDP